MHQHRHDGAGLGDAYEGGRGSPLVLLHGLTGTWHIWKPVLGLLEQHHRVIAITLPGHSGGPSLPSGSEASIASMADAVIADLRARGVDSAHIAGNSIGGWLALELARRGFALSVTALSPAGGWRSAEDYRDVSRPFRMFHYLMPLLLILLGAFTVFAGLRRALVRQTMERGDRIPAAELLASLFAFIRTAVLLPLLGSMGRDGPFQYLSAPGVPIRIAWSACDRVIPYQRYGTAMLERVPQAELVMLAGVGHVPMYDDPEAVAACILEVTGAAG
ncbi:MAG: alpha/beta hydrolase [Hydrocarboniphaga sp.]|uniref:alpha/beta fold hydrolase n=1 Tax=Hydrocarboniphaga sp. TaxID=2033016 RepID=UPI00262CEB01|nr:alpha/beta fold hydrolase [Hydrocarboniphaga sp.]MDB5971648.1 alpha/beta hydrolase [Hydrocarboniphaga sp.]